MKHFFYFLAFLSLASCQKESFDPNFLSTEANLSEVRAKNGGNITCDQAASSNGVTSFEYTTGRQDYPFSDASFDENIIVETDGTTVSWTIIPPDGYCVAEVAVIVKGGPAANVYFYVGVDSGSGLTSPINSSGNPAGLSNLTICYNLVPCTPPDDPECEEETAFGGNIEGGGSAWWYAFEATVSGSYPIHAGQNAIDGASIEYDALSDVITINLGSNMFLQDDDESVKVQGYNDLPSSRPAAGLFTLYKGTDLTVSGDGSQYYVVHLDVVVCN